MFIVTVVYSVFIIYFFYLPHVTFAYNTFPQDTTIYSPFMLVYGQEPIQPTEVVHVSRILPYYDPWTPIPVPTEKNIK